MLFIQSINFQFQILKRGDQKKKEYLGGLEEFLLQIYACGGLLVPCQKRFCEIKYGFVKILAGLAKQPIDV